MRWMDGKKNRLFIRWKPLSRVEICYFFASLYNVSAFLYTWSIILFVCIYLWIIVNAWRIHSRFVLLQKYFQFNIVNAQRDCSRVCNRNFSFTTIVTHYFHVDFCSLQIIQLAKARIDLYTFRAHHFSHVSRLISAKPHKADHYSR